MGIAIMNFYAQQDASVFAVTAWFHLWVDGVSIGAHYVTFFPSNSVIPINR